MKFTTSGVPARVKRRFNLVLGGLSTLMIAFAMLLAASAGTTGIRPVAQCYPSNDMLAGALNPLVNRITGAVGGLIPTVVTLVIVVGVFAALFTVFRRQSASALVQGLLAAPVVVFGGMLVLIVFNAFYNALNGYC